MSEYYIFNKYHENVRPPARFDHSTHLSFRHLGINNII